MFDRHQISPSYHEYSIIYTWVVDVVTQVDIRYLFNLILFAWFLTFKIAYKHHSLIKQSKRRANPEEIGIVSLSELPIIEASDNVPADD